MSKSEQFLASEERDWVDLGSGSRRRVLVHRNAY